MDRPDRRITRRHSLMMMAGGLAAVLASELSADGEELRPLRLAISIETLAGDNVNDARAAYLVWLREIARHYPTQTATVVPQVFIPSDEIVRDVRQGLLDCYGVTALELAKLLDLTELGSLVIQDYLADGIDYVLLVNRNSPFKKLADLHGTHLVSHLHRDMVLQPAWLGTLLAASGLPQAEHFFADETTKDKINQVILPVFFRRADAACVARPGWETAVELNPQLGHDLVVLAISPKVIPIAFGFRKNTSPEARKALISSIQSATLFTSGQQIVELYQSRAFVIRPLSVMNPTMEMLRQYERLSGQARQSRNG